MPGGCCPYCNVKVKVTRMGKQPCPNCKGRIDVDIKVDHEKQCTQTYLRAVDTQKQRREDNRRWSEIQHRNKMKKLTASLKGE